MPASLSLANTLLLRSLSLPNASKAIDGIKKRPEYAELRVSYGKDRCANPPRAG